MLYEAEIEKMIRDGRAVRTPFIGASGGLPGDLQPRDMPLVLPPHVAIQNTAEGEALSMRVDLRQDMKWSNDGYIYQNRTEDIWLYIVITVSPILQQGGTNFCQAILYIGKPYANEKAAIYTGTNIYSSLIMILSRGIVAAWVPPAFYYQLTGQFGGRVDWVARYWLPDPGEDPPLQ